MQTEFARKQKQQQRAFRLPFKLDWFIITMTTKLPIQFTSCATLCANGGLRANISESNWKQTQTKRENMNLTFRTNFRVIKNWHQFQHFNKVYMQFLPVRCFFIFIAREKAASVQCNVHRMKRSEEAEWERMALWILCVCVCAACVRLCRVTSWFFQFSFCHLIR